MTVSVLRMAGVSFTISTYVLFLKAKGLNPFEISAVNIAFFATCLLCEWPTGALADVIGCKTCVVASCLISAVAMLTYSASGTKLGFVTAESLAALGSTMASGAFTAWLASRHEGERGREVVANTLQSTYILSCLVGIVGAYIGVLLADPQSILYQWVEQGVGGAVAASLRQYHLSYPWYLESSFFLLAAMVAFWRMEPDTAKVYPSLRHKLREIRDTMGRGWAYARTHQVVRMLLLLTFFCSLSVKAPDMQWPQYFVSLGLTQTHMGHIWLGISLSLAGGAALGRWLRRSGDHHEQVLLLGAVFVIGAGIAATVVLPSLAWAFGSFFVYEVGRGLYKPLNEAYLTKQIPNENERATVLSLGSMPVHIGSMIGLAASGYIAKTSFVWAWVVSGIILMAGVAALTWQTRHLRS